MATATSVTLSTCWTVRERGLARRGSPRAETPLPRGSARHTTLSASPCGWQPLAHARPAPGAGPPFRLFPSHALHDANEYSPRCAALGQTWLCITTCIGLQGPPMMGEHGPMPPSHFGQMGGPGPFGGGRGRGSGRGGPGDGFRSAFYSGTTYTSGNVTWRHLQKALYCDKLQQKVWKQNLGTTCTLLQRIIAAGSVAEPVKGPEALQARCFALGSSHARAAEAEHHRHCPATAPQHQGIRDGGRPEGDRTNLKGCCDCQSYTACPWYGTMAAA